VQSVHGPANLERNRFFLGAVGFAQAIRRFREESAFLLDQQQPSRRTDDREIDFSDQRESKMHACPVQAVVDGVIVRESVGQDGQSVQFTLRGTQGCQFAPAFGDNVGHRNLGRFN